MDPNFRIGRYKDETVLPYLSGSPPFTIEVADPQSPSVQQGETLPRRHPIAKDGLFKTPHPGIATVFDVLKYGAENHTDKLMMGWRKIIKTHREAKLVKKQVNGVFQEVEKKWTYYELSPYEYISYKDYWLRTQQIGAGLAKLGMNRKDRLHVFAATGPQWLAVSHGAVSRAITIVTAYDTLGEDGLRHSLKQSQASGIFTEPELLEKVGAVLDAAPKLKNIVYHDLNVDETQRKEISAFKGENPDLNVMSFEELRLLGQENMVEVDAPNPQDICCIMYTSGSTGLPKGVPIRHKAIVSAIAGASHTLGEYLGPEDKLLSYLPLAHIFEFLIEHAFVFWGMTLGYGSPKTLTDTSVRNCKGDIREFRPSLLVGVPAVWELIKKGVVARLDTAGYLKRNLFWGALALKDAMISYGLPGSYIGSSLVDQLVFKQIKEATGGRLRLCLYGGGPISKETHRFISLVICPMLHGYGLTETCAIGALTRPANFTWDSLGDIPPCIEVKLVDFPDAGYYAANQPPQGEVWIRGDPVADTYFDNEQETHEAITPDGWFKTGDIGEFDEHGFLRIIDRKKNLVKTLNGEYIALEKLEVVYRTARVSTNVCVYAAPQYAKPVAVVVPDLRGLKAIGDSIGMTVDDVDIGVHDKALQAAVLKELQAVGRHAGLTSLEIIEGVILVADEWTTQNKFLTAAQKLVRKKILETYKDQIHAAYAQT